ncbi:endonuclease [Alcanivorax sediminis]|uniref:Endonuclease I n=2 Tax=Alcanivorax sediminis TaxID=2663008 RepID=A0A6N7LRS5_9GAMM|nr:endonuclease [Alcanivorax sediminis]MQX52973.1 endonuclease I [Alcanivorax sediminis]
MNKVALVLLGAFLLVGISYANDQDEEFIQQLYPDGGKTLYCQEPFASGSRISIEEIYDDRRLAKHFGCRSGRLCSSNKEFTTIQQDLHGRFPVTTKVELERRRTLFGELPDNIAADPQCGYQQSFQVFEPPAHAKGEVARAMLYLHDRYQLPFIGTLEMYQRWNREDPVDEEEKRRNDEIEKLQGNRNPFIDSPDRADTMKAPSPLNMQFP